MPHQRFSQKGMVFIMSTTNTLSKDPYFRDIKQFFPVEQQAFTRKGAWMGLVADSAKYGRGALFLTTNRGNRRTSTYFSTIPGYNRLYRIRPTFEGRTIPFAIQGAAAEYTLHTRYGDVRFTWADSSKLMAEGDKGMGLLFSSDAKFFEIVKKRRDGAWATACKNTMPLLFKGLEGSSFAFDEKWDFDSFRFTEILGRTQPDPEGKFTLVVEEFFYDAYVRDEYPTYAEARASMQADWEEFLSKTPHYIEPFEKKREETAYFHWSHLVCPSPLTPNWLGCRSWHMLDSQWLLVQRAVALQEHTDLCLELLTAYFHRQSEEGELPGYYDDSRISLDHIFPPIYGWALKDIMSRRDITKIWPREKIEYLYQGAGRWADWIMKYRDNDGDGLPSNEGGEETGIDQSTIWHDVINMTSPDISAFTVLSFEAQGDLAKVLGKPEAEVTGWYKKSKDLLKLMIDRLWDGEHFVAIREFTHEPVFTGSLTHYFPFVLGSRLPQDIIDKMAEDLSVEGGLLSEYGLASERLDSDLFEVIGKNQTGRGAIAPPNELFIVTGMWDAGKKELARKIIDRYCGRLVDRGFAFIINPITGDAAPLWDGWPRVVFAILCRMVSE